MPQILRSVLSTSVRARIVSALAASLAVAGVAVAGPPQSDDFDAFNLNTAVWTVVDPVGDGVTRMVGADTGDAVLELVVAGGATHDPWRTNRALRVMQTVDNGDFEIEVAFQSEPSVRYQMQGLMFEQDSNDWVRFDFYHDGSRLRIFGARTVNGSSSSFFNVPIDAGDGSGLRVTRTGNQWSVAYLNNGTTWTTAASSISHSMVVNGVGLFAANHYSPATLSPEFTAVVDYFQNNADPIVDEDGGAAPDVNPPVISNVVTEAISADTLEIRWQTDEAAAGAVAYGLTDANELGVEVGAAGQFDHFVYLGGLTEGETYHLEISAEDEAGNIAVLPDFTVLFEPPPPPQGPVIDVWYGLEQSFGAIGQPQPWVNILGNVSDPGGSVVDLSYRLNGSAPTSLSLGPDTRRLLKPGDFNVDLATADLNDGSNFVELTAIDNDGEVTIVTVQVNYTSGTEWPLPYTIDWSTLTDDSQITEQVRVVDGKWRLTQFDGQTMVRTAEPGYDRLLAIGDQTWVDYEFEFPIVFHSAIDGQSGGGVLLRWNGHSDDPVPNWQPKTGWRPSGATIWGRPNLLQILAMDGPGNDEGLGLVTENIQLNVPYIMKGRVETIAGGGARYSVKMWPKGTLQPTGWDLVGEDSEARVPGGSMLLLAHLNDVSYGNVTVRELVAPVDVDPPVISDVAAVPTTNSALISWTTNEPSNSVIEYGLTDAYGATVSNAAPTTSHSLYLTDLTVGTTYHYRVSSTDAAGNTRVSDDFTFTTSEPRPVAELQADEFNEPTLDTSVWTFDNTLSPDTSLAMTGTQAALSVPAGSSHENWTSGIRAPRIVQYVDNGDFHIEAKFDSLVIDRYQQQGFIVEQDPNTFLRFELIGLGNRAYALVAAIRNGVGTIHHYAPINISPPYYLRVRRSGTNWTQSVSGDGVTWQQAGVINGDPLVSTSVGVYAGNARNFNSPAHTALVDHFRIVQEAIRQPCAGDLDADGVVTGADLALLLGSFGALNHGADLDGSGSVDSTDLGLLLSSWGECP